MRKETENWWKQANRDIESAKKIMELGEYHVCAFLSQQAVEKGLKAPSKIIELCATINPAYTSTRYPDVASDFDKGEVEEIVISAEEILEWIKKELKL